MTAGHDGAGLAGGTGGATPEQAAPGTRPLRAPWPRAGVLLRNWHAAAAQMPDIATVFPVM